MFAFYPNIQGHITGFDGSSKTYKIRNVIWTEHCGNNWSNQLDVKSPWNLEGGVGDGMCMGQGGMWFTLIERLYVLNCTSNRYSRWYTDKQYWTNNIYCTILAHNSEQGRLPSVKVNGQLHFRKKYGTFAVQSSEHEAKKEPVGSHLIALTSLWKTYIIATMRQHWMLLFQN
jgi:hypothetical protein